VYVVVVVLFNAGLQVPVIPLLEVVGNGLNKSPLHIAATGVKVGVISLSIFTLKVVGIAHCAGLSGVKV
jgi:hypothetical protein